MSFTKRIAIGLAAVTVAGGGGLAVSQVSSSGASTGNATPTAMTSAPAGAAKSGGGQDVSALAKDLGVSTSALQKAMSSAIGTPTSGSTPSQGQDEMAAKLAKALGLSQTKVEAALKANQPSGGPPSAGQLPSSTSGTASS